MQICSLQYITLFEIDAIYHSELYISSKVTHFFLSLSIGDPPVCTLKQYYECLKQVIGEFNIKKEIFH